MQKNGVFSKPLQPFVAQAEYPSKAHQFNSCRKLFCHLLEETLGRIACKVWIWTHLQSTSKMMMHLPQLQRPRLIQFHAESSWSVEFSRCIHNHILLQLSKTCDHCNYNINFKCLRCRAPVIKPRIFGGSVDCTSKVYQQFRNLQL